MSNHHRAGGETALLERPAGTESPDFESTDDLFKRAELLLDLERGYEAGALADVIAGRLLALHLTGRIEEGTEEWEHRERVRQLAEKTDNTTVLRLLQ